jgi:signal transduction histidine kinase
MPSASGGRIPWLGWVWVVWTACFAGVLFTASQFRARLADLPVDSIGQWTAESSPQGTENPSQTKLFGPGTIESSRIGWWGRASRLLPGAFGDTSANRTAVYRLSPASGLDLGEVPPRGSTLTWAFWVDLGRPGGEVGQLNFDLATLAGPRIRTFVRIAGGHVNQGTFLRAHEMAPWELAAHSETPLPPRMAPWNHLAISFDSGGIDIRLNGKRLIQDSVSLGTALEGSRLLLTGQGFREVADDFRLPTETWADVQAGHLKAMGQRGEPPVEVRVDDIVCFARRLSDTEWVALTRLGPGGLSGVDFHQRLGSMLSTRILAALEIAGVLLFVITAAAVLNRFAREGPLDRIREEPNPLPPAATRTEGAARTRLGKGRAEDGVRSFPWRTALWGAWAAVALLWLGAAYWVGRVPEHWPQGPVGWWTGETNGRASLWPLALRLGGGAHLVDQGSNVVYQFPQYSCAELGRFTPEAREMTLSTWVNLAGPTNGAARLAFDLLSVTGPKYRMYLHATNGHLRVEWVVPDPDLGPSVWRTQAELTSTNAFPLNEWFQLTLSTGAQFVEMWMNGNRVAANHSPATPRLENASLQLLGQSFRDMPSPYGDFAAFPEKHHLAHNRLMKERGEPLTEVFYDDIQLFDRRLSVEEIQTLHHDVGRRLRAHLGAHGLRQRLLDRGWPVALLMLATMVLFEVVPALRRAMPVILTRPYRPVVSVFVIGGVLTSALWIYLRWEGDRADEARFARAVERLHHELEWGLLRFGQLANSARDWYSAHPEPTQEAWSEWTKSMNAEYDMPGFVGIGFAERVVPSERPAHESKWIRRHGFPYSIATDEKPGRPFPPRLLGRPSLPVVLYQPCNLDDAYWRTNATILGQDLLALRTNAAAARPEPLRIEDAVGNGSVTSSGLEVIAPAAWYGVEEKGIRLYSANVVKPLGDFAPIPPENWSGVAFVSISLERGVRDLLTKAPSELGFRIYTGNGEDHRTQLALDSGSINPETRWRDGPQYTKTRDVRNYFFRLTLDCWTTPYFERTGQRRQCAYTAIVGAGFTLLSAALLFVQVRARERQAGIATDLREANLRLTHAERERARLSRDLHDGTVQSLYAVGLHLQHARNHLANADREGLVGVDEGSRLVQETIVELRGFLLALKEEDLNQRTFRQLLDGLVQRLRRTTRVEYESAACEESDSLSPRSVVHLINISREAVSNALRHGQPTRIQISFDQSPESGRMVLEIRDNGRGFDPLTANRDGLGMLTLRERAAELGGTIELRSSPGDGTVVRVEFTPAPKVSRE